MRICPFCSTENEAFFRFCLGCGADLDEALGSDDDGGGSVAAVPAPAPAPVAKAEAPKKKEPAKKTSEPELPSAPAAPPPKKSSKDTAIDMPVMTPEMIAQMTAQSPSREKTGKGGKTPSATPGSPPPRVSKDREKTLEPGGAVKPGSAASQAVAQAQGEGGRQRGGQTEQVGAGPAASSSGRSKSQQALQAAKAEAKKAEPAEGGQPAAKPALAEGGQPGSARPSLAKAEMSKNEAAGTAAALRSERDTSPESEPVKTKPTPVSSGGMARPAAGAPPGARAQQVAPTVVSPTAETATRRSGSPEGAAPAPPSSKKTGGKAAKARLVIILEDGTDGSILDLTPETTVIGREGVDISFPHDDFLAKRHAEFAFSDGILYLKPLESTNGVFLQVHQEVELENGDVFRIGQQLLCFEMLSMVASTLSVDPKGQAIPLGSPVPEGAWGRLGQLIAPDTLGSVYLLGGNEVYLGRERGDITFPGDGFVSGLHAQISMRNGRCFLKDLGSSNGTYLRLSKATPVRRGMLVLAGQQLFRVES